MVDNEKMRGQKRSWRPCVVPVPCTDNWTFPSLPPFIANTFTKGKRCPSPGRNLLLNKQISFINWPLPRSASLRPNKAFDRIFINLRRSSPRNLGLRRLGRRKMKEKLLNNNVSHEHLFKPKRPRFFRYCSLDSSLVKQWQFNFATTTLWNVFGIIN